MSDGRKRKRTGLSRRPKWKRPRSKPRRTTGSGIFTRRPGIAAEQLMRLRCAEAENMAQEQDARMLREAEESFAVLEEKARKRIPDAASRLAALIE